MEPLTVSGQPAAFPSDERIVVLGLGYVGLPLALSFVEADLSVVGLDVNSSRVDELRAGRSPIGDVSDARLGTGLRRSLDVRGLDRGAVQSADAVIVCVPTPMDAARQPDLGPVLGSYHPAVAWNVLASGVTQSHGYSTGELTQMVSQQSSMIAFNYLFRVCAIVFLVSTPLTLLMKRKPTAPGAVLAMAAE